MSQGEDVSFFWGSAARTVEADRLGDFPKVVPVIRWSPYPGSFEWNHHPLVLVAVVFWDKRSPYQSGRLDRFYCGRLAAVTPGMPGAKHLPDALSRASHVHCTSRVSVRMFCYGG